jgi:hypothetical protein
MKYCEAPAGRPFATASCFQVLASRSSDQVRLEEPPCGEVAPPKANMRFAWVR